MEIEIKGPFRRRRETHTHAYTHIEEHLSRRLLDEASPERLDCQSG